MANIIQDGAAITYLKDLTITVQGAGADDGNKVRTPSGDSVTFKVDSAELNFSRTLEDHSQGQSEYEHMRTRKKQQSLSIDRKPEVQDALYPLFAANEVFIISVTGTSAGRVPEPFAITAGVAILGELSATFGAPSTGRITFATYGSAWL